MQSGSAISVVNAVDVNDKEESQRDPSLNQFASNTDEYANFQRTDTHTACQASDASAVQVEYSN